MSYNKAKTNKKNNFKDGVNKINQNKTNTLKNNRNILINSNEEYKRMNVKKSSIVNINYNQSSSINLNESLNESIKTKKVVDSSISNNQLILNKGNFECNFLFNIDMIISKIHKQCIDNNELSIHVPSEFIISKFTSNTTSTNKILYFKPFNKNEDNLILDTNNIDVNSYKLKINEYGRLTNYLKRIKKEKIINMHTSNIQKINQMFNTLNKQVKEILNDICFSLTENQKEYLDIKENVSYSIERNISECFLLNNNHFFEKKIIGSIFIRKNISNYSNLIISHQDDYDFNASNTDCSINNIKNICWEDEFEKKNEIEMKNISFIEDKTNTNFYVYDTNSIPINSIIVIDNKIEEEKVSKNDSPSVKNDNLFINNDYSIQKEIIFDDEEEKAIKISNQNSYSNNKIPIENISLSKLSEHNNINKIKTIKIINKKENYTKLINKNMHLSKKILNLSENLHSINSESEDKNNNDDKLLKKIPKKRIKLVSKIVDDCYKRHNGSLYLESKNNSIIDNEKRKINSIDYNLNKDNKYDTTFSLYGKAIISQRDNKSMIKEKTLLDYKYNELELFKINSTDASVLNGNTLYINNKDPTFYNNIKDNKCLLF